MAEIIYSVETVVLEAMHPPGSGVHGYTILREGEDEWNGNVSQSFGFYPTWKLAYDQATQMCKDEHERLGWPEGDERIQYPIMIIDPFTGNENG